MITETTSVIPTTHTFLDPTDPLESRKISGAHCMHSPEESGECASYDAQCASYDAHQQVSIYERGYYKVSSSGRVNAFRRIKYSHTK